MDYNIKIELSKKNGYTYFLVKSNQEEIIEIQDLINTYKKSNEKYPFLDDVIIGGHIKEIFVYDIKEYMNLETIHKTLYFTEGKKRTYSHQITINEYQCYVCKNRNMFHNLIIHEDALSSFRCACASKNIEYFYILKQEIINNKDNE